MPPQMTIIMIYVYVEDAHTKKTEIIEKLMQKIENHINLHKGTLIESHRIHRKKKICIHKV
jgi:hypothetical protein